MSKALYGQINPPDNNAFHYSNVKDRKRLGIFALSALLALGLFSLHQRSDGVKVNISHTRTSPRPTIRAQCGSVKSQAGNCTTETKYYSSELEQQWLSHADEWGADYCRSLSNSQQTAAVRTWLSTLAAQLASSSTTATRPNDKVFSRFVTTTTCAGQPPKELVHWIEPLSHGLRHPQALCSSRDLSVKALDMLMMNTSYLWLADGPQVKQQRTISSHSCINRTCQNIYIDLGATTWADRNYGAAGQQWFVRSYAQRGIEFDRLLLWEAKPVIPPSKVYDQLPQELMHKYQYFNIPATADLNQPAHPMRILKQIAQPGDFVVFKLDIDNAPLETSILQAIMDDPDAFALVDGFFFEYHVNFQPMLGAWRLQHDPSKTLADAYKVSMNCVSVDGGHIPGSNVE